MDPSSPPDAARSDLEAFKTLVRSYHPVIAIDTVEEDRVERLLQKTATDLGLDLMEWSVTSGLRSHDESGALYGTTEPRQALSHIAESKTDSIYWLKDFTPHLSTPRSSASCAT